ncbi:MAG TPA: acetylornithine transaminase [Actinomycetes bacterium]|jgi:acetylornithine aminotransferase|nr:acetylornithine transaminase [Actinomycetes bacterium]
MTELWAREAAVLWPTYARPEVEFVRGSGVRLWDARGREYLDFLGGIAVVAAGHAHPRVVEAISRQLATLGHTSNLYFTGPQVALAERLVDRFGGGAKVFLSNSGAEANEAAIKVARRWGRATRGEEATGIVAAEGGFHGRTLATLAATGKPAMHPPFAPLPAGFTHVPFGDADALAAAIGPRVAAVLVEPIQGEAGIRVPPPGYLRAAREVTAEAGVLLILDEIQSGMGRTGRLFAHQRDGIRPDVVTMAKALGSGYPIGATIARAEVADAMRPGDHGTTFGGNPVACAAALATLDVVEPLLDGRVDKVGARLADGLQELRGRVGGRAEVRGAGLWLALDLGAGGVPAKRAALAALGRGLVVNPVTETALRLAPPLVVTEEEVDEGLRRLAGALEEVGACR